MIQNNRLKFVMHFLQYDEYQEKKETGRALQVSLSQLNEIDFAATFHPNLFQEIQSDLIHVLTLILIEKNLRVVGSDFFYKTLLFIRIIFRNPEIFIATII